MSTARIWAEIGVCLVIIVATLFGVPFIKEWARPHKPVAVYKDLPTDPPHYTEYEWCKLRNETKICKVKGE